jgi:hypothetical protein
VWKRNRNSGSRAFKKDDTTDLNSSLILIPVMVVDVRKPTDKPIAAQYHYD